MRDMIRHGLVLNLIGILLLGRCCYLLAGPIFGIDLGGGLPPWAG